MNQADWARVERWVRRVARSDSFDDVYVAPASIDVDGQRATFHFYANPRVRLIWLGALGVLLGGFFLMLPWNRIRRPHDRIDPERRLESAIERKKAMLP